MLRSRRKSLPVLAGSDVLYLSGPLKATDDTDDDVDLIDLHDPEDQDSNTDQDFQ